MMRQSFSGPWHFRFEGDEHWQLIEVPGCWERLGVPKNEPGPAWYRREVFIPPEWAGKRIWLRFEGVSYACQVHVNGAAVGGEHLGAWDGFRVEITGAAAPGATVELLVRVEKPASLTRGPDSEHVPGRYPQKETLSGFLPYVWGHMFGGIWQEVWLEATGEIVIERFLARGDHEGRVHIEASFSQPAKFGLEVRGPDGKLLEHLNPADLESNDITFDGGLEHLTEVEQWSPESPALYEARISVIGGETRTQKFGMRSIRADGSTLMLNERPIFPRMILSWGWYEQSLHANPGREQVRRDFERLRSLGYNGVKLCLWVPPRYYFELADEMGMLLWLELPMWMPQVTEFFLRQTPEEYERIVRQVRQHPSIIFCTLGCELDAKVGADFLAPLYSQTKKLIGDALLRDNSGSGEAYGGLLNEFAEYYDYHFYSDIQFFRPLLESFAPRWRRAQPFLFGEYCDADTWGDLRKLYTTGSGRLPWWARDDEHENPQGARWQHDVAVLEPRLREHGLWERQDELERVSYRQALVHRKFTIELVRTYREVSGYVITGERDTPISKAGMWTGISEGEERMKFEPADFAAFNADVVLSLGWDKRRAWINGGDRAAPWDTFSYVAGDVVRAHIIASNYGGAGGAAVVEWVVAAVGHERVGEGGGKCEAVGLEFGEMRELGIAEFVVAEVDRPVRATLRATSRIDGAPASGNEWPLWIFPRPAADLPAVRLVDTAGRLDGVGGWLRADDRAAVVLATAWTDEVREHVERGGRAILLQSSGRPPGLVATAAMPFWREAIKLIEPHPAWGDFPHESFCDLQFFGMATDCALESAKPEGARSILGRVDSRTAAVHDYAVELSIGPGRVIVSTLRFEGGLGEQPLGLSRNTAAAYLLSCWVRYLAP